MDLWLPLQNVSCVGSQCRHNKLALELTVECASVADGSVCTCNVYVR